MTPRTLAAFAAGALVGVECLQVVDALRRRSVESDGHRCRCGGQPDQVRFKSTAPISGDDLAKALKILRPQPDSSVLAESIGNALKQFREDILSLGLDGKVQRDRSGGDLQASHDGSPSSMGATSEGSGAGGSKTSPPAPTSGARP